jgi:hypothetical protein
MNANELIECIERQMATGELEWRQVREDIHETHKNATTEAERVLLLSIHKAVIDAVERNEGAIIPGGMDDFRKAHEQDYKLLLVSEGMIGRANGLMDPMVMRRITDREVTAGRMSPDDELRTLALQYTSSTPPKRDLMARVKLWFGSGS